MKGRRSSLRSSRVKKPSHYLSVDIEADGPIPGIYSVLAIGICSVFRPSQGFYAEFKPISDTCDSEALKISGLDRERLGREGMEPKEGLESLRLWVQSVCADQPPVFVGFNAPFDFMFLHWYFVHFLGEDPFGYSAFDIKAYVAGVLDISWEDTTKSRMPGLFLPRRPFRHHALDDARWQAQVFRTLWFFAQKHPRRVT